MDGYLTCRGKATWVSHTYACAQPQGRIQRGVGALPTPTRSIGKREKRMREEKGETQPPLLWNSGSASAWAQLNATNDNMKI
jgi:hypothetical protein